MRTAGPRKFVLNLTSFAPTFVLMFCCAMTWPMVFMRVAVALPVLLALNVALNMPGCTFTSIFEIAAVRAERMAIEMSLETATTLPVAVPSVDGFLSKSSMIVVVPSALMPLM